MSEQDRHGWSQDRSGQPDSGRETTPARTSDTRTEDLLNTGERKRPTFATAVNYQEPSRSKRAADEKDQDLGDTNPRSESRERDAGLQMDSTTESAPHKQVGLNSQPEEQEMVMTDELTVANARTQMQRAVDKELAGLIELGKGAFERQDWTVLTSSPP